MELTSYIANFFAGAFLCNCIPHLTAGLRGELFPTPFASPPGRGDSSAVVNVLWGTLNLVVAVGLLAWRPLLIGINLNSGLFLIAFLGLGILMATHFQKVRAEKK